MALSRVNDAFKTFAEQESGTIGIKFSKFKEALCAVRPEFHYLSVEEAKQLFVEADLENDEILKENEFAYALNKVFPVEQALSMLPLHRLLESALPGFRSKHPNEHLEIFVNLSEEAIATMISAVSPEIERLVWEMVCKMRQAKKHQNTGGCAGAKFVMTLSAGTIDDFHDGLQVRVGGYILQKPIRFLF